MYIKLIMYQYKTYNFVTKLVYFNAVRKHYYSPGSKA